MNTKANISTDRQDLKRKIRQLESIAALSGGIAHDYNNLLTAIMGNISLALAHVETDASVSVLLEQALAASRVAKTLTRRLITFSKGGHPDKKAHGYHPPDRKYRCVFPQRIQHSMRIWTGQRHLAGLLRSAANWPGDPQHDDQCRRIHAFRRNSVDQL